MHYYEKKQRAAKDLDSYLLKDNRAPWSVFSKKMLFTYGFDSAFMKKMLSNTYPELDVENDNIVRISNE